MLIVFIPILKITDLALKTFKRLNQIILYILSANIRIDKAPPPNLPRFTRHPRGLILNDGDEAVIECTLAGRNLSFGVYEGCCKMRGAVFSSPEPSGSQGELIVYPCSVVRPSVRPSSVRPSSTIVKDLLL